MLNTTHRCSTASSAHAKHRNNYINSLTEDEQLRKLWSQERKRSLLQIESTEQDLLKELTSLQFQSQLYSAENSCRSSRRPSVLSQHRPDSVASSRKSFVEDFRRTPRPWTPSQRHKDEPKVSNLVEKARSTLRDLDRRNRSATNNRSRKQSMIEQSTMLTEAEVATREKLAQELSARVGLLDEETTLAAEEEMIRRRKSHLSGKEEVRLARVVRNWSRATVQTARKSGSLGAAALQTSSAMPEAAADTFSSMMESNFSYRRRPSFVPEIRTSDQEQLGSTTRKRGFSLV